MSANEEKKEDFSFLKMFSKSQPPPEQEKSWIQIYEDVAGHVPHYIAGHETALNCIADEAVRRACKPWPVDTLKTFNDKIAKQSEQIEDQAMEIERLKTCLEPGKASAIVDGMWRTAEKLNMPNSSWKHCLTWFKQEIEMLRHTVSTQSEQIAELIEYIQAIHHAVEEGHYVDVEEACLNANRYIRRNALAKSGGGEEKKSDG